MTVKISGTLPSGAEGRYNGTYNVETGWTLGDSVVLVVECDVDSIEQKAEGEIIRKLKPTRIEVGDATVKSSLARLYDARMSVGSMFPEGTTMTVTTGGGSETFDADDPELGTKLAERMFPGEAGGEG